MADMLGGGGGACLPLFKRVHVPCPTTAGCVGVRTRAIRNLSWRQFMMDAIPATAPIFTALGSANRSSVSRSSPTGQQVYPPIHCGLQRGIFALPQSPFYLLNASPRLTSEVAANAPAATLFAFLSLYVCVASAAAKRSVLCFSFPSRKKTRGRHMPRRYLICNVCRALDLGVGPASSMLLLLRTRQHDKPCYL
ncbi:hypothetical protein PSV08DRAFT_247463 [Bipolaris maydis]|uniref:uncharacterized protein n=1 Tax=Cochliobolus heterostrophus TaxID=5016 RepID=UPI0024DC789B|nr:hypothetical protein PSV08DRAFT_247463 [Bipolaris maydis]